MPPPGATPPRHAGCADILQPRELDVIVKCEIAPIYIFDWRRRGPEDDFPSIPGYAIRIPA